jgi:hypothetical protein
MAGVPAEIRKQSLKIIIKKKRVARPVDRRD